MIYSENTVLNIKPTSLPGTSNYDHVFFPAEIKLLFEKKPRTL